MEAQPMIRRAAAATLLLALVARPAAAQQGDPITIAGLGTIAFPTSTASAAAESTFVRGVLLLHLFHYDEAAAAFQAAQVIDPGMAMAYWGEAMTHTHGVWNEQDLDAARSALAKYAPTAAQREAKAPNARERGYLRAVDLLYGDGPKASRDTLFADAMAALSARYPADDEARAFHALALLGLSQSVRNVPTYLEAAAIAESIYARNPRHPGAAHYWIHGMDDPQHAAGALVAARALSEIAPDAGHAQHMTSHIFLALGMWDDVVRANLNAMRVVNAARSAAGRSPSSCGHYNFWLEYGYLQLERFDEARALVEGCIRQATTAATTDLDPDNSPIGSAVGMWARFLIDTQEWDGELARWAPPLAGADAPRATWTFVHGLAAARRGDTTVARKAAADFYQIWIGFESRLGRDPSPDQLEFLHRLGVLHRELAAELALARVGARVGGEALAALREATRKEDAMPYAFGPPFVDLPSHERLGEVLLQVGRPVEAAAELEAALKGAPNRRASVRGLAAARAAIKSP